MEEKKATKISLSTFFLILAIIIIVIMSICMYKFYNEKTDANKKTAELQTEVSNLNRIVSVLQGKIDEISSTVNSDKTNTTNIDDKSNDNKNSSYQPTTEETIKNLFLAKLKALDNSNSEKLLDYRVDKVEILSNSKKQSLIDLGYNSTDMLAYVTYSVKPQNVTTTSWVAGNGEVEGEWVINKIACECLRNGKLVNSTNLNTGW
jgi:preprotein translocase subunit YajC